MQIQLAAKQEAGMCLTKDELSLLLLLLLQNSGEASLGLLLVNKGTER